MTQAEGLVYPEDWYDIVLPQSFEEIFKRYGLGAAVAITTPAILLARTVRIGYEFFHPISNLKLARLGDSNAEATKVIASLLPPSSDPLTYNITIEERRFTKKVMKVTIPAYNDYEVYQVGTIPSGFGGRLTDSARILPKVAPQLERIAREVESYFNVSKFGCGYLLEVRSLGGTEILNLSITGLIRQTLRSRFSLNTWIIDKRHPNLLPLIALRLKAGFNKNEIIVMRINEKGSNLIEGDVALAKTLNAITTQYGGPGQFDSVTLLRMLTDMYGPILSFDFAATYVPVFPAKEERKLKILLWEVPYRKKSILRKTESTLRAIINKLEELYFCSKAKDKCYFIVIGSLTRDEADKIIDGAKLYFGKHPPLLVSPSASEVLESPKGYYFMKVVIVQVSSGLSVLQKLFGCEGLSPSERIPEDILDKVIDDERSSDVRRGLEMAARFYGLDVLNFIKGGNA